MNYFMQKVIKNFYSKPFVVSNTTNRMWVRIEGNKISSIKSHNIASEGIIKGSIQVPGNGNPIILMAEHPTIGGYPKIATVILADIARIAQFTIGTKFNFKEVTLAEAEAIFREKNKFFESLLNKIECKWHGLTFFKSGISKSRRISNSFPKREKLGCTINF